MLVVKEIGNYPMVAGLSMTLKTIWAETLGVEAVKDTDSFLALGGDSLAATAMAGEVERRTGLPVPVGQIYLTPVLMEFQEALERLDPDEKSPLYVPMRSGDGRPELFGIAPAMGGIFHFRDFAEALPEGQGFAVLEPQVSATGAHPYTSVEELAACCLQVLRSKQPQGPYQLAGYSFGGIIAWEMARQLEAGGESPPLLILLDTNSRDSYALPGNPRLPGWLLGKFRFLLECNRIRSQYEEPFYLARCWPLLAKKVRESLFGRPTQPNTETRLDAADMEVAAQRSLSATYERGKYRGHVHLFRSDHQLTLHREIDFDLGWSSRVPARHLHIATVPGDHFSLMRQPSASKLVARIMKLVDDARKARAEAIRLETEDARACAPIPFPEPLKGEDLAQRFLQVCQALPRKIALCDGSTRLTYGRLETAARAVAAALDKEQPGQGGPVLLHFENTWQFTCAIYGVLLAGRAYVPIDPAFPPARIEEIATIAGATAAITLDPEALRGCLPTATRLIPFATALATPPQADACPVATDPTAPAIYLFTSGSTGQPKGSIVSRRMLLHLCWRHQASFALTPRDRYPALYVSAFMGAVGATHPPILAGAALCFYNLRRRGLENFQNWLAEERVTILHAITSIQRSFFSALIEPLNLPHLRLVVPGGEPLRTSDIELWRRVMPSGSTLCTGIGSTECGTLCLHRLPPGYRHEGSAYPIGIPYPALGVTVEKADGSPAAPMEEGEIVVTSHYIFEGYINAPELNASVVTRLPDGRIRYRTGDYGYFNESGVLHNLGRRDARVKVMGNLVELGEIESVLHATGLVEDVAVVLHQPEDAGEPYLAAFYRPIQAQPEGLESRLAGILLRTLPVYMMPRTWTRIAIFPRTVTGKIDRRALSRMTTGQKADGASTAKGGSA